MGKFMQHFPNPLICMPAILSVAVLSVAKPSDLPRKVPKQLRHLFFVMFFEPYSTDIVATRFFNPTWFHML